MYGKHTNVLCVVTVESGIVSSDSYQNPVRQTVYHLHLTMKLSSMSTITQTVMDPELKCWLPSPRD